MIPSIKLLNKYYSIQDFLALYILQISDDKKTYVFHFCIICLFLFLFSCSFTNSINTFSTIELYSIDAGLIQNGCKSKCIKTTVVVAGWPMGALDYSFSRKCIFVKIRKMKSTRNLQNFWHDMKLKHWEIFSNILVNCFINLVTWIFVKAYSGFKTAHYPFTKFVTPKLKIFSFWRLTFQERNCKTRRYFRENSLWSHSWRHP